MRRRNDVDRSGAGIGSRAAVALDDRVDEIRAQYLDYSVGTGAVSRADQRIPDSAKTRRELKVQGMDRGGGVVAPGISWPASFPRTIGRKPKVRDGPGRLQCGANPSWWRRLMEGRDE